MIDRSMHVEDSYRAALTQVPRPREPLSPRRGAGASGGCVHVDDDLLERTLAFSGAFVSDDGNVTVRRFSPAAFEYSGHRFVGHCAVCARALLLPATGEPLDDVASAVGFVSVHGHGDVD